MVHLYRKDFSEGNMKAKQKPKLIPSRGTVEDWSPDKEAENLRKKEEYSKKMAKQEKEGEPDFEQLLKKDLKQ